MALPSPAIALARACPALPTCSAGSAPSGSGAPGQAIHSSGAPLPEGAEPEVQAGDAGQALASAIAGLGKAMLPLLLCDEAIEAKQLTVLEGPEEGRRAYWLVAPRPQWRQKKVRALVAFLTGGAGG